MERIDEGGNMIRLTERYYDTYAHGYCSKPLFLSKNSIAGIESSGDRYEDYTIIFTAFGQTYTVLESAETIAMMCDGEKEET